MSKSISNKNWSRIGKNPFGLGMERFRDSDDKPLWRFVVTLDPHARPIEIDAKASDLMEIIRFCEQAIETLETDGGRNVEEVDLPTPALTSD